MSYEWKTRRSRIIAPQPYDDDHVLIVGDIEVEIHVYERTVAFTVYPEPQRPPDPTHGTIYGREVAAGHYIDCEPNPDARARALLEAKAIGERVVEMLKAGIELEVIHRESGSTAWWDAWRARNCLSTPSEPDPKETPRR